MSRKVALLPALPSCQPNPSVLPPCAAATSGLMIESVTALTSVENAKATTNPTATTITSPRMRKFLNPLTMMCSLFDSVAAKKDGRCRLLLLGDQLVAVDENQIAGVERDRPSARGVSYMIRTDIHCVPSRIAETFDHSATDLRVRPRIYTPAHSPPRGYRRYRQPSR